MHQELWVTSSRKKKELLLSVCFGKYAFTFSLPRYLLVELNANLSSLQLR